MGTFQTIMNDFGKIDFGKKVIDKKLAIVLSASAFFLMVQSFTSPVTEFAQWEFNLTKENDESFRGLASGSLASGKVKRYSHKPKKTAIIPQWNRINKIAREVNSTYLGTSGLVWTEKVESSKPTLYQEFFDEKALGGTKTEYNRMVHDQQMREFHGLDTREDQIRYLEKSKRMSQKIAEDAAERKAKIEGREIQDNIRRDDNRELMTAAGAVGLAASVYKGRNLRVKLGEDARLKSHVSVRRKYGELTLENPIVDMGMQYSQQDQDPVKFLANRKVPLTGATAGVSYSQKSQTRLASIHQPLLGGLSLGLETEYRGDGGGLKNQGLANSGSSSTNSAYKTDNRVRVQYGVSF